MTGRGTPISGDQLAPSLLTSIPWSPREFVPGISKRGDRAIYVEELTRPLPTSDDLRFIFETPGSPSMAVLAERLPWDSEFFGVGIARFHGIFPIARETETASIDKRPALESLIEQARRRGIAYLFGGVDPRDLPLLRALGESAFVLIETRTFHHGPIEPADLIERWPVRRATPEDIESLATVAARQVNPFDRFHADPFFRAEDVARLMRRWVEESIAGRMADIVIVPDVPRPTAFVTYRYHQDRWERWDKRLVQGVLSAVDDDFTGWMDKLDPEIMHHLRGLGAEHVFGSTQVTNASILWFAEQRGARFGRCEHIFRLIL